MLKVESFKSQIRLKTLNTVDLRLLVGLSMFSDYDGRINATLQKIKDLGYMTPKLVESTLERLITFGWIRKEGTAYYTTYTTNTSPKRKKLYYINLFKFFQTDIFKTMYKRDINFLFYILTTTLPGRFRRVAIERLYKNKINENSKHGLIIDYFTSFEDLVSHLTSLIEKGIIEVRLCKSKSLLTQETTNIKEQIYNYCGKDKQYRKKRMRNQDDHHSIDIRISEKVLKEKTTVFDAERLSTLQDLDDTAAKYCCSVDCYEIKDLDPIHMFKHKLYTTFGNVGLEVYREELESYFKHQGHEFEETMEDGAAAFVKVLKNYYVMPKIIIKLKELFKKMLIETRVDRSMFLNQSNEEMKWNVSLEETFKKQTAPYVRYIKEEAYDDEIIKLDYYMMELSVEHNALYRDFTHINKDWLEFKKKVNSIFRTEELLGNTKQDVYRLALNKKLNEQKRKDSQLSEQTRKERRDIMSYNWLDN
ncbi:hypothetical protein [Virgibacillus halodenitrificans]|uniref:hypothetical protein n=1 Tax=Virgibacillus halodenitrificans TaxID=1482 RepID=UPI000EF49DCD|nr:hypothetical protein [Virgibacillus halodenitrificans]